MNKAEAYQAIEVLPRCRKCGKSSMRCYGNIHGVVRYRLCEGCGHREKFTVVYCDTVRVTVK
jgi:hypothetical protein